MDFGKHGREGAENGLEVGLLEFVKLDPLAEDAVRLEFGFTCFKKFAREKAGSAGEPWVGGFRDDDVVFAIGDEEMVARIVDDEPGPGIGERIAVEWFKEFVALDDGLLELDAFNFLDRMA